MEFFTPVNRAPTGFFERRKSFRSLQRFVEYIIEDFRVALNFLSNRGSFFCNVGIRASSRFVNIPLTGFLERFSSCANSLPRFLFVSFTESDIGYIRFSWIFFSILVLIKQNFSSTRWSFFWKDSSSFFPNKRDYLRAVSLYYSFDSVHPEFRTWIYIGNMSNTRLTLLWENINFFMYLGYTQFDTDFCMLEEDEERGYREYRDFGIRGVWIGGVYNVNRVRCLSMFILEFCSSTSFTLWSRRAS